MILCKKSCHANKSMYKFRTPELPLLNSKIGVLTKIHVYTIFLIFAQNIDCGYFLA